MMELLKIRVTELTREELQQFSRIITVDTQPRGLQQEGRPRFAVIDHHPPETESYHAEVLDIRPHYGATATMLTEYLRALDEKRIGGKLATALLFGIRTDTDSLTRAVSPPDVEAYAFLQARADLNLVRRFERPSYPPVLARCFGRALASAHHEDGLWAAWLGELEEDQTHILPDFADFCLDIEGVTWVAAAARVGDTVVVTLRHAGMEPGAGDVARALATRGGSGGGHASMARVVLEQDAGGRIFGESPGEDHAAALARLLQEVLEELSGQASRPTPRPARQVSNPAASRP
jgi:nanoRNase/pAp phosphatase (c-di-AMP/oligoRNAs hydrolase)